MKARLRGDAIWKRLFRLVRYRTLWVVAVILVVGAAAYIYARQVPLRSSYFDLLPRNDPLLLAYRENQKYLAVTDSVVFLVSLDRVEGVQTEARRVQLLHAAEEIATAFRGDPEFKSVTYLFELNPKIPKEFAAIASLSPDRLAKVQENVELLRDMLGQSSASVPADLDLVGVYRQASQVVDDAVASGLSWGGSGAVGLGDLLALNQVVLAAIEGLPNFPEMADAVHEIAALFAPQDEVKGIPYFSRDASSILISALPQQPSGAGVEYCNKVRAIVGDTLARVDLARLGVTVGIAGSYSLISETEEFVSKDMARTGLITSAGVLLVFLISFGSVLYSLIAAVPLLVALLLTNVWTKGAMGGFNLLTTFVPSLILGMGDDFAIHLISRFTEERNRGVPFSKAVYTMLTRKGPAILLGALTIVLVFLGLVTAQSRALFELGAIAGVGILLAIVCALVLIPTMLTLAERVRCRLRRRRRRRAARASAAHAHFTGLFRLLTHRVGAIVVVSLLAAITGGALYLATGVRFQFSSSDLVPRSESQATLDRILTTFDLGGDAQLGTSFLYFAETEAEMKDLKTRLLESSLVLSVRSPLDLLPANLSEQQAAIREVNLAAYADGLAAFDRGFAAQDEVLVEIRTLLTRLALVQYAATLNGYARLGLDAALAQDQLLHIQTALRAVEVPEARDNVQALEAAVRRLDERLAAVRDLPQVETLLREILRSLPPEISNLYLTEDGRYIVRANMSPDLYARNSLISFIAFSEAFTRDYFGIPLVVRSLEDVMKRDFYISTGLAALLILIVVWRSFRKVTRTLLALAPVILGYIWMLGGMRILDVHFNFINIIISPLLIGLGIESGVTLLFRYLEERDQAEQGAIVRAGASTAVPILTSMFTTMLVFASLLLAHTPGLRFLGACALLGIGFSLLITLLLIPAAISLTHRAERGPRQARAAHAEP